ncbi:MAG: hypothetical protein M3065_14220 [Actinomycetota bacterium]|nr:hypothetical protein [Actinomycetota bacterium]
MTALAASLAAFWICAAVGAAGAWLMRRRAMLSVRKPLSGSRGRSSPLWLRRARAVVGALLVIGPLAATPTTGALLGRRWRLADLGAV